MITIYKYELKPERRTEIKIPGLLQVVHVGLDANQVGCIWAQVNTEDEEEYYNFYIFGTGHEIDIDCHHLGSFIDDPFVWHVYMEDF